MQGSGVCSKLIVLEYKCLDRWILFRVTVSNQSGHEPITDLTVEPESLPLASTSRFTLRGKGLLHYGILLMALLSVGIAIYALVLCIEHRFKSEDGYGLSLQFLVSENSGLNGRAASCGTRSFTYRYCLPGSVISKVHSFTLRFPLERFSFSCCEGVSEERGSWRRRSTQLHRRPPQIGQRAIPANRPSCGVVV